MAATDTELEALVGHLFVVGGRTISAASPGAIATPPPRRVARGRDADTLFGLLSLGPGEHQPAAFYEKLTEEITTTYFNTSGASTSALREAISAANSQVQQIGASLADPITVGLSCAILRHHEVYIAMTGPSRWFLIREGFVERLPVEDESREGSAGLGVYSEPDVRFYRREIRAGDFLILADASFDRLTDIALRHTVESGEVSDALSNLASVAGDFSVAEVIKFVTPLIEGEADRIPATRPHRVPSLPFFGSPVGKSSLAGDIPGAPASAAVASEAGEETSAPQLPRRETGSAFQRARYNTALKLAQATKGVRTLVEHMLPDEEAGGSLAQRLQLSTTMQIGVALAVAVIVALITTAVYRFRGQTSQYAQLVREAQSEIEAARAGGDNQAEARPHWETAVFLLDQAAEIRGPGQAIADLRAEALAALDAYDHATRVTPVLLRSYEPGAYLRGPIVQGLNLYVIDTTQDVLYREDLDEGGTRLVNREPQIVTRQGDLLGNQVVGGLIDLAWMEEGGVPQRNVLAVLSRNGLLITYSPSWDVTAAVLPGFEAWQDPRAIAIYDRDLYILDAGANEIWRYEAGPDSYANAPQRYFTDVTPSLVDAIDMEIDTNGNVYILHASGQITKYFFGRPDTFRFEGLPQPLTRPTALFLNLSLYDRTLFIADPGGGRLYTSALNGTFLANYKDSADQVFDALSGVYNQDRPPYVYVTAGSQLYYFSRPQ